MSPPRLLAIMGSGETAPTMIKAHRAVFERLARPHRAVLLDTPFGFQENAQILADRAVEYFRDSVGETVTVADLRRTDGIDPLELERALARLSEADWVFAGPGSPTYALRQWADSPVPALLSRKLTDGGALVFSSAAALTLGVVTLPVYEIYKVGEKPRWEPGLDLLSAIGVTAAVIPHFDNAEGGNHDTRFCYLGQRRLELLEAELPADAFVLGVDEHTGLIVDIDAGRAEVVGRGGVTLRRADHERHLSVGETVSVELLARAGIGTDATLAPPAPTEPLVDEAPADAPAASLSETTGRCQAAFDEAIARGDAAGAGSAALELESAIVEWSRDTLQSDEADRARAALRAMLVRLAEAAIEGLADPRERLAPVVEAALDARRIARSERAFAVADALRDGLVAAGIEVHDTPDGSLWELRA